MNPTKARTRAACGWRCGPLTTDLIGGQISMSFDTVTPVLPHIKADTEKFAKPASSPTY